MSLARVGLLLALLAAALAGGAARRAEAPFRFDLPAGVPPPAVPADNPMSAAKVELGRRLFYDADLSADGTTSCGTCHEQRRAFTDGNATHPGVTGEPGRRNPMGLADVGYFSPLTWADPTRRRLEDQALTPLDGDHPVEMGMKGREPELVRRLAADPCYRRMFQGAFPEHGGRIDEADAVRAIAAFERTLLSFDAPYDQARRGAKDALSPAARRGERLFFGAGGCAACHAGRDFTDQRFHRIAPPAPGAPDRGLFETTQRPADDGAFRTPSLRNVELTGPYLHDGSAPSLAAAIRRHVMAGSATGTLGDPQRLAEVIAFLDSLTDRSFVADPWFALPKAACDRPL
jgi:cytochrome c peroxidase